MYEVFLYLVFMPFELTILGSSSATPTAHRNPTAQILNFRDKLFLIDCGEGTQSRIRQNRIKFNQIEKIFISHLHGDHYFGLLGLLSTYNLMGREKAIDLYGPAPLKEIIDLHMRITHSTWRFPLNFHPTNPKEEECIFENDKISIHSFPLIHRVDTTGFRFNEKPRLRPINRKMIDDYNIPYYAINRIKEGEDFILEDGTILKNDKLTFDPPKPRSYAFCSDTVYTEKILPYIENVDLLYHEATFLHELAEQAKHTKHTTARQAGEIATKANVGQLLIGHFSSRYKKLDPLLEEAKLYFKNSHLALEGRKFEILDK